MFYDQLSNQQTAKKALEILVNSGKGFVVLTPKEKQTLLVAFARKSMVLYGRAFDIVKTNKKIDFTNEAEILANLKNITVCEVKSTNRKNMPKDSAGYFFDFTTSELLVAQSLKDRYKIVFVNTITKHFTELTLNQVFAKAKGIYPKWAIRF